MKTLIITAICFLAFVQLGTAQQKLYVKKAHVQELSQTSDQIQSLVTSIESVQKSNGSLASDERKRISKLIFITAGGCEGIARNVVNAEKVTTQMLAKYQMYENEYEDYAKKEVENPGYYNIQDGDAEQLAYYTQFMKGVKEQLRVNGYRIAPGLDNAEENLALIKQFNKTYANFVGLLESRFVAL